MNPIWYEALAVIVVLMLVGVVLIRAFTAPLPQAEDRIDIFMRRRLPGTSGDAINHATASDDTTRNR